MTVNRYKEYEFAEGWASVSTITGMLEKPYLYGWYAKLGKEAYRIVEDSKKIGNLIDNEICHYFGDKETPEIDRSVLNHPESKAYYLQAIQNFHKLADHIKPTSVFGQQVVYSKKHKYIGTLDRLMVVDGRLVLSDWKATNSVDYPYKVQLEAYYRALTEMIDGGIIVLDSKFRNLEWHEFPIWLCQFPKKEEVNLDKHIVKFKPKEVRFNNFLSLLSYHYGKIADESEEKLIKKELKITKKKKEK